MSSQHHGSLSQRADERFAVDKNNFQESLPKLKEFLRNSNRQTQLRALKSLMGPCVAFCAPDQLGKNLFDDAAPLARNLFFETINEVDVLVSSAASEVLDDVVTGLEYCIDLLECWFPCLAQLAKFEKLSASEVRSILQNLVEVIKRSFEHCRTSAKNYGALFDNATERLTLLFRKTNETQNLFYQILERVIVFHKDVTTELATLVKVVNFMGETCPVVKGLDMKTEAESWRGFAKIAITYCNDLKTFSPPCVTKHLTYLADSISSSIRSIVNVYKEVSDHGSTQRTIKLQKLLLKILQKLCHSYSQYLANETAQALVRLLVQLHRCSPSCLKTLNVHLTIIEFVEANITTGIDQLLDSVVGDLEFTRAFFNYEAKDLSDEIGYHLFTTFLIQKLITVSTELRDTWRKAPHDILEVAFANSETLEVEFLAGKLCIDALPLYDATLTSICGLVASTSTFDFHTLEILLLKHLLGGNFCRSLLAADIWCFVAKYASSDLNHDHIVYLMEIYESLQNRSSSTEAVMLGSLIARLNALALTETKNRLIDKFQTVKAHSWLPLRSGIASNDRIFLRELTATEMESIASSWQNLNEQPSAEIWTRLVNQLSLVGILGKDKNSTNVKTLRDIWSCVGKPVDEYQGIHLHLVTQLTIVLLEATQSIDDHEEVLCSILSTLTSLIPRAAPHIGAHVSHFLKESTEKFASSGREITTILATLYCLLLKDDNPWGKQEALESYEHVTKACYNEELVTGIVNAVSGIPQIWDTVSQYVSRNVTSGPRGFPSTEMYLRQLFEEYKSSDDYHVCPERANSPREDKRRKIITLDTPNELRDRVTKLSHEIDYVLSRRRELDQTSLAMLEVIVNKLLCSNDT